MILFSANVGHPYMSGRQRMEALERLGKPVVAAPQDAFVSANRFRRVASRVTGESPFSDVQIKRFNASLLVKIQQNSPRVVWLEKPLLILPETIESARKIAPGCKFVSFQDDDPFGFRPESYLWRLFESAIPLFDLHFVKRLVNVQEFSRRGAKHVAIFTSGYAKPLLDVRTPSDPSRAVSFIGTALDHRVRDVAELILHHHVPVDVYGDRWNRHVIYFRRRAAFHPPAYGQDYARLIADTKICLGFVSSSNRDEYTMRSFEIPAIGSMLLAERTEAHLEFFSEGCEAEFFSDSEECADKIRFYLGDEGARQRVAAAGRARSVRSDYSLDRRMKDACTTMNQLLGVDV